MTNEKIMIVKKVAGHDAKITTVDSSKRNQIKDYTVNDYSHSELADKIVNRIKKDNFTKLYIDGNGVNTGIIDWVLVKLENTDYTYNPKTGDLKNNSHKGIRINTIDGSTVISGSSISWDKISVTEEF